MVWEKEVMKGLKEEGLVDLLDHSHKTKSVAECYKPVRDLIDDDAIKDYLPDVWVALIKVCPLADMATPLTARDLLALEVRGCDCTRPSYFH